MPYAAGRGAVYLVMGALTLVELAAVHLLVPWHRLGWWSWLQWLVLALSAWGVGWVVDQWLAERRNPHLVGADALVLRRGRRVVLRVPYDAVGAVTARRRGRPEDRFVLAGPGGDTNLDVELLAPVTTRPRRGRPGQVVAALSLEVDDPDHAARAIEQALARRF